MRKKTSICALFGLVLGEALLQGCSAFGPTSVAIPQPSDLSSFYAGPLSSLNSMTPDEIVDVGYAYVDAQCTTFFDALQKARNVNDFSGAEITAAIGATAVGCIAIGAIAIGRLAIRKASVDDLTVGNLRVGKLSVENSLGT